MFRGVEGCKHLIKIALTDLWVDPSFIALNGLNNKLCQFKNLCIWGKSANQNLYQLIKSFKFIPLLFLRGYRQLL